MMVDYKELFFKLCQKISGKAAYDNEFFICLTEELFEDLRNSDATPDEIIKFVSVMGNGKKFL